MSGTNAGSDPLPRPDDPAPEGAEPPASGRGDAVDHERQPGVPPPDNDDYSDDMVDHEGAESFPASDPPSGW